ncbi:MAG: oxygen-independent coproporphyrinogen III oxidase-like protein [Xanthomonadaceae bacterium]|nr:oxygen-independent coproporphyrinogen III oxidase-like protein [Xanthomonadaceae bacterium]
MSLDPAAIPLALYLHFPWCVRKCPYCDFNSHGLRGEVPEDAYVEALIRDLAFELAQPETRPVGSIFMGGGTPSLFSGRAIGRVLEACAAKLNFAPDIEITLEANPGTVDAANFRDYRAAGVNRLSIGVQSLNDAMLKRLGRIHGHGDVVKTVDVARGAGFDNLNLDLMYALPQQTEAEAEADLRAAIALAPEHLSYYQLTLEPNTEFAARPPPLPDDDSAWTMQLAGQALLAAAGYAQYEVSAYARPGRQCRHNRNYWQFGDYLGIGAGAHGKRSFADRIERRARHKLPRSYQGGAGTAAAIQEQRRLDAAELPFEFVMNALRLNEGFTPALFETRSGLPIAAVAATLAALAGKGLIEQVDGHHRPTSLGRAHLNTLVAEFL